MVGAGTLTLCIGFGDHRILAGPIVILGCACPAGSVVEYFEKSIVRAITIILGSA